jgi:hypothetical protein
MRKCNQSILQYAPCGAKKTRPRNEQPPMTANSKRQAPAFKTATLPQCTRLGHSIYPSATVNCALRHTRRLANCCPCSTLTVNPVPPIIELQMDQSRPIATGDGQKPLTSRLIDVFLRTWDLGFTAFGGPPVHFQILHARFVEGKGGSEKWVDEQTVFKHRPDMAFPVRDLLPNVWNSIKNSSPSARASPVPAARRCYSVSLYSMRDSSPLSWCFSSGGETAL